MPYYSICLTNIRGSRIVTPCKHTYHLNCLKRIMSPYCPICRYSIKMLILQIGISKKILEERLYETQERIVENVI